MNAAPLLAFAKSVVTLFGENYPKAGLHLDMDKASVLNAAREAIEKATTPVCKAHEYQLPCEYCSEMPSRTPSTIPMKPIVPSTETVKRCTACRHFVPFKLERWGFTPSACTHQNNQSAVDGSLRCTPHEQRYERINGCGEDGKWWEQK